MQFKLKFEAFQDVLSEVMEPVSRLQALALPREGGWHGLGLIPPGPNPYRLGPIGGKGMQISLSVGWFLRFDSVIVEDVSVEWEARMGEKGPMGATVNLVIATYEMLTQEKIAAMYRNAVQVSGAEIKGGVSNLSISGPNAIGADIAKAVGGIFKSSGSTEAVPSTARITMSTTPRG